MVNKFHHTPVYNIYKLDLHHSTHTNWAVQACYILTDSLLLVLQCVWLSFGVRSSHDQNECVYFAFYQGPRRRASRLCRVHGVHGVLGVHCVHGIYCENAIYHILDDINTWNTNKRRQLLKY